MSVKIISDSACDIVEDLEGLEIIPITVTIDGVEYKDGVDLSHGEFYEKLVETNGIDFDRPYMLGYSGFGDSMLKKYIEDSRQLWEGHVEDLPKATIGATIGTHIGPGAIGVAFFQKTL